MAIYSSMLQYTSVNYLGCWLHGIPVFGLGFSGAEKSFFFPCLQCVCVCVCARASAYNILLFLPLVARVSLRDGFLELANS